MCSVLWGLLLVYSTICMASEEALKKELTLVTTGQVTQIIDPIRVEIDHKKIVQLSNIDIPDLTPYAYGEFSGLAKTYLEQTLLQKQVRIYQTKNKKKGRTNRMGHMMAHLVIKNNEQWVQGALLTQGLARIHPAKDHIEMVSHMQALETQARIKKTGLWAKEDYQVYNALHVPETLSGWAIIEGTVLKVATVKNKVYLNFGADWRTDFTIVIPSTVRRALAKNQIDPLAFSGKSVRIRGWVEHYNGPSVELLSPVWLEHINLEPNP